MSEFIESLKRLYNGKTITDKDLKRMLDKGTITQEEYDYIVGV